MKYRLKSVPKGMFNVPLYISEYLKSQILRIWGFKCPALKEQKGEVSGDTAMYGIV